MKVKLTARTQAVSEDIKTSEDLTVFIARVSNPENQKNFETGAGLLRYCIRNKHWSVFEQVDFTFEIETTRAISAQILRHRSFTFQEFCIKGDSLIKVDNGRNRGHCTTLPIKDLYSLQQKGKTLPKVRVFDEKTHAFTLETIKEVFSTGIKPLVRVTLDGGKYIDCTTDHKLMTRHGFKRVIDITMDDFIGVNGQPVWRNYEWLANAKKESLSHNGLEWIAQQAGCTTHNIRKWLRIHSLQFTQKEIAQYKVIWNKGLPSTNQPMYGKSHSVETREEMRNSAHLRGVNSSAMRDKNDNVEWRKRVAYECVKLKPKLAIRDGIELTDIDSYEIDHIMPASKYPELAFELDNMRLLKVDIHKDKSNTESPTKESLRYKKISSIEPIGDHQTFDMEINHTSHNYVANGIVTHNSQRYSPLTDGVPAPEIRLASKNGNRQSSSDYASEDLQQVAAYSVEDSYNEYLKLLNMGAAPETARNVLPLCTPTMMYMKGNLRSWITYLIVRKDDHTQKEHRELATQIYNILKEEVPSVFEALSGIYEVFGYVKPSWWARFNSWIENNIIK